MCCLDVKIDIILVGNDDKYDKFTPSPAFPLLTTGGQDEYDNDEDDIDNNDDYLEQEDEQSGQLW